MLREFPSSCADNVVSDRKINTSPSTVEEPTYLKMYLTTPPVKKIDLHFPLGIDLTARNLKGVTIKDALDAIYKAYKKRVRIDYPCSWAQTTAQPLPVSCYLGKGTRIADNA
jgi:hypothetical protein